MSAVDPRKAVERQMILVLAQRDVREQAGARHAAVDDLDRAWRSDDRLLTLRARVLGSTMLFDTEVRRYELEHLADVVANATHRLATLGAGPVRIAELVGDDISRKVPRKRRALRLTLRALGGRRSVRERGLVLGIRFRLVILRRLGCVSSGAVHLQRERELRGVDLL